MITYPFQIFKQRAEETITELRDVDFYLNQDSTRDKSSWVKAAPALYFEFAIVEAPRDHGKKIQSAVMEVTLHLLTENLFDNAKRLKKQNAQDHMFLFDKIYFNFNNFSSKLSYLTEFNSLLNSPNDQRVFNSLSRVGIVLPHTVGKGLMKSSQKFRFVAYDHAAQKQYTKQNPDLELTTNLEFEI